MPIGCTLRLTGSTYNVRERGKEAPVRVETTRTKADRSDAHWIQRSMGTNGILDFKIIYENAHSRASSSSAHGCSCRIQGLWKNPWCKDAHRTCSTMPHSLTPLYRDHRGLLLRLQCSFRLARRLEAREVRVLAVQVWVGVGHPPLQCCDRI
jgi:hypothetical protein